MKLQEAILKYVSKDVAVYSKTLQGQIYLFEDELWVMYDECPEPCSIDIISFQTDDWEPKKKSDGE